MKITEKQQAFLDGLICQRLTADRKNKDQVPNFSNQMSWVLTEYFLEAAWKADEAGNPAIYVIKNQKNEILFYFGLRCGELQTPLDEEELKAGIELVQEALYQLRFHTGPGVKEQVDLFIESIRNGRMDFDVALELNDRLDLKNNKLQDLLRDKHKEKNTHVVRVLKSYPAVEMTHFVANDEAAAFWSRSGIKRKMGETFFWQFIVPKVQEIRTLVGCDYLYLFSADRDGNRSLVNYYHDKLHFEQPEDVGTNKPRYDFTCEFMCQKMTDLEANREKFFETFNSTRK